MTVRLGIVLASVGLAACTYGPAEDFARAEQILPLGDSFRAVVVVRHDRYRAPAGLAAFPDGGKRRYEARAAVEYLMDARERTAVELARQEAADSIWESFDAHVRGLEGDSVAYLELVGCPRGGACYPGIDRVERIRLTMDGRIGPASEIPRSASLPGTTLARRPEETHYVRYGRDGDIITGRFDVDGPYVPLFRVAPNGTLTPIVPSSPDGA